MKISDAHLLVVLVEHHQLLLAISQLLSLLKPTFSSLYGQKSVRAHLLNFIPECLLDAYESLEVFFCFYIHLLVFRVFTVFIAKHNIFSPLQPLLLRLRQPSIPALPLLLHCPGTHHITASNNILKLIRQSINIIGLLHRLSIIFILLIVNPIGLSFSVIDIRLVTLL